MRLRRVNALADSTPLINGERALARRREASAGAREPQVAVGAPRPGASARAFTLLEILVALALIGLLAGVLVVGSTRMLSGQPQTPEDIFRRAVSEARKYAVENNTEVRVAFDTKAKAFVGSSSSGSRSYPIVGPDDLSFDFLPNQTGGGSILIAGNVIETQKLSFVTFYPDGTCTPFRVQVRANSAVRVISIDPWTCAPVLESEKK